jgi:hypothetical protein
MAIGTFSATQLLSQIPLGQLQCCLVLAFGDEKQDIIDGSTLCPDAKKLYFQAEGVSAIVSFSFSPIFSLFKGTVSPV